MQNAKSSWFIAVGIALLAVGCAPPALRLGFLPKSVQCVAVLPFETRYEMISNTEYLSEFLYLDLTRNGARGVAGPREVTQLFQKARDPLPPSIDPYWAREIGRKLGVDAVIFGAISQIPVIEPRSKTGEGVAVGIEAYLIDPKTGEIRWLYDVRDIVPSENLVSSLTRRSSDMANSLLAEHLPGESFGAARCWKDPPPAVEIVKAPAPTPTPTAIPRPLLTSEERKVLETLRSGAGWLLTAETFEGRTEILTKEGIVELRKLERILKDPEGPASVRFAAHIDSSGDSAVDLAITRVRAEAVVLYMEQLGVPKERMEAVGLGDTQPVIPNLNERSRQKNRRIEVTILREAKP